MFNLEIEHPTILKIVHEEFASCCDECGRFYSIVYLVVDENRNVFRKTGCMEEIHMCPSCFNFFFALNPSKKGEPYH